MLIFYPVEGAEPCPLFSFGGSIRRMPLTACPDCATQVSAEAVSCPRCGRPLRARAEGFGHRMLRGGCWLLILIFAALGLLIMSYFIIGQN